MASGRNKLRDLYTEHIDNDIFNEININSREELIQLMTEPHEHGRINWEKWDKIVQETKEKLSKMEFPIRKKPNGNNKPREKWVYSYPDGKLLGHFNGTQEVIEAFPYISNRVVNYYSALEIPYKKENIYFSNYPLTNGFPIHEKKENTWKRKTCAYNLETNELIKCFNSQTEAALYFGMVRTQVSFVLHKHNGVYLKGKLRFQEIIEENETTKKTISLSP